MTKTEIPGYDFGAAAAAHSPVSMDELRKLEACVGWTGEDADILQKHRDVFLERGEQMVDAWRSVIGSQPHLAKWFFGPDGKPDEAYKAKVKERFVQWVRDVCLRPHDQAWLNYQEEIGLRHTPARKNDVDGAHTPDCVPLRYLFAFTSVIALTTRRFFVEDGVRGEELRQLQEAWTKAVILHVTLWSRPYVRDGLW
jgi:Protoglobin